LVWEARLLKFVDVFMERREKFMALYTTENVEEITWGMEVVNERTVEMSRR
jgi:hypothetical protein